VVLDALNATSNHAGVVAGFAAGLAAVGGFRYLLQQLIAEAGT
jgi:hypothetical protein